MGFVLRKILPNKLSYRFILIVVGFAFLPFIIYATFSLIGAVKGMNYTWNLIFKDHLEAKKEEVQRHLFLQKLYLQERLNDVAFELRMIATLASSILSNPERYPSPEEPILPVKDPETFMYITPKEVELSIHLPSSAKLTEEIKEKILALNYLSYTLRHVHDHYSELSAGVSVFTKDGIDFVYPWHDFKKAVASGFMKPAFKTFTDWAYSDALRRQNGELKVFYSPVYEDAWGPDNIISVLVPVKEKKGQTIALVCMDIKEEKLLSLVHKYKDFEVKFALLDSKERILGFSRPLLPIERVGLTHFLKTAMLQEDRSENELETKQLLFLSNQSQDTGLMLVGIVNKRAIISAVYPLKEHFTKVVKLFTEFGLIIALVLLFFTIFFGRKLAKGVKLNIDRFILPLKHAEGGDFKARIAYKGYEELEYFAKSINTMLETIEKDREQREKTSKELEEQNEKLKNLLGTLEAQREAIEGLLIPIIPVLEETILAPIAGIFDSRSIFLMSERVLGDVKEHSVKHVIFDMTGCPLVDTHKLKALIDTMTAVKLLGAKVHVVGLKPALVKSIVSLGIDLDGVFLDVTLDKAIHRIEKVLRRV